MGLGVEEAEGAGLGVKNENVTGRNLQSAQGNSLPVEC